MEMPQQTTLLSKEHIRALPTFQNLDTNKILVIQTPQQCLSIQN